MEYFIFWLVGCRCSLYLDVFDGLVLHEDYVAALYDLLFARVVQLVPRVVQPVSNKDTLPSLGVHLGPFIYEDVY